MSYNIFTDGACRGNPGIGSWGFVVFDENKQEQGFKTGVEIATTNNAMELMAIKNALLHVCKNVDTYRREGGVTIHTDSAFCINVITQWMDGWEHNGWTKKSPGPIKNLDIIKEIHAHWHRAGHSVGNIQLAKVAGHSGNYGNDRVDQLCNKAIDAVQ